MEIIGEKFYWVRDRDFGMLTVGRRFSFTGLTRGPLWDVMLPGWHDYEDQKYFDECCEVVCEIERPEK